MNETPKLDNVSFPGGYDITDIIVAVKLAEMLYAGNMPTGEVEQVIVQRFLGELTARHPGIAISDPVQLRAQELLDERRSLLNSHLKFSWFCLAHWVYVLVTVRSSLSLSEHVDLSTFLTPVRGALLELGVRVSEEECLAEVDRFVPAAVTPRSSLVFSTTPPCAGAKS